MEILIDFVSVLPLFALQLFGLAVILTVYLISLAFQNKRAFRYPVSALSALFIAIVSLHTRSDVKVTLTYACCLLFADLAFLPVLLLGKRGKREGAQPTVTPLPKEFDLQDVAPMPEFYEVKEVKLTVALQVLRALKERRLSMKDRMDADVMQNMLTAFEKRDRLTGREVNELNGCLSRLLKLISAYTV